MVFLGIYRAVYDYAPQSEEELEIKEGDVLFVLEKSVEEEWWRCKKKAASDDDDEPEGLVPINYVEEAKPVGHARALYDYTKQTDEEMTFKEDARLAVYDETDPDWTLVGYNGEYGFAPAIYIEAASSAAPTASHPTPMGATPAAVSTPGQQRELASPPRSRELAPPPMPTRPTAFDEPLPGEADYPDPGQAPTPSPDASANNPAAALAGILSQRTDGAQPSSTAPQQVASPPLQSRLQYTPDESEEEEPTPPPMPQRPQSQLPSPRSSDLPGALPSPPYHRAGSSSYNDEGPEEPMRSPGGYHLYNIHEMITHMGKSKKMPTTLGINIAKGVIMISPEKSRDGPSQEWTADKLTHYSIEGKHVFVELVRPSKSVDFHAGAKDTAQEIVAQLGELAGASRAEGLREVLAASAGTGAAGMKKGQMLYEFMAQSEDEVTVAVGDEVMVLDDTKSEEWWMVRRLRNGKEGVVPSSYVEITGTIARAADTMTGLNAARSTVEQNRLEEERLAKEAAKKEKAARESAIPERNSSLAGDQAGRRQSYCSSGDKRPSREHPKSKPNQTRVRTWTDRSGTFKVEAEFIGLRDGKIHLHKMNGVKIAVPVSKMAVEDLEYVERATGASLDEDKPLSDIKRRTTQKKKDEAARTTNGAGASVQKKDEYDWFDFFLQCGVNPQICERYASAFSRDQMSPEVLPEVNEQLLRTLGLKEGDILRVVKFLDGKYDRRQTVPGGVPNNLTADGDDNIEPVNGAQGGMFSGPGGTLRNNTRKGRPAPAVQTNDVVDEAAFKQETKSPAPKDSPADRMATTLTSAPARQPVTGFDDDAWDVKPTRTPTSTSSTPTTTQAPAEPPKPAEPPRPKVNDDIAQLSITSPPLQPAAAPQPAPQQSAAAAASSAQAPQATAQPQGADQAIFDKIAALKPQEIAASRQRPLPPVQQQQTGGALAMPPPQRASSAPGFPPQQSTFGAPAPLQPHYTGYQAPTGQNLQDLQNRVHMQQQYQQPNFGGFGQPNGIPPQPTGVQAMQQNFPALQATPTGFQPPFNPLQQQPMMTGFQLQQPTGFASQPTYQQALVNGHQTGSPFADPPRQPFQPMPSGLSTSYIPSQPTTFGQHQQPPPPPLPPQQPSFNLSQPTGAPNGVFGQQVPQLPPQQTGGVFGPSQPLQPSPASPLVPQKTGPAPPVRFGVQPGQKPLAVQPTGRANLAKATPQNPFGF